MFFKSISYFFFILTFISAHGSSHPEKSHALFGKSYNSTHLQALTGLSKIELYSYIQNTGVEIIAFSSGEARAYQLKAMRDIPEIFSYWTTMVLDEIYSHQPRSLGMFFPKGSQIENLTLPENTILLGRGVTQRTIIHEFMHFLFTEEEEIPSENIGGDVTPNLHTSLHFVLEEIAIENALYEHAMTLSPEQKRQFWISSDYLKFNLDIAFDLIRRMDRSSRRTLTPLYKELLKVQKKFKTIE